MQSQLEQAVAAITGQLPTTPRCGVILGSGQGHVAAAMQQVQQWSYRDLPGLPIPSASGHAGYLQYGYWQEQPCLVAQGRSHFYEGNSWDDVTSVCVLMISLGIRRLVLTNAAGGLNPQFRAGQIMVIRDHLNLMFRSGVREPGRASAQPFVYDSEWSDRVMLAAGENGVAVQQGVYAGVLGPNYETRAEYRMLRRLGADAVGMSTVPEAITAAHHGVRVLGLSVITNEARPDAPRVVSHEEVIDWAGRAESDLRVILEAAISAAP